MPTRIGETCIDLAAFFQLSFWIGEAEADPKSSNRRQSLPDFGFSAAGLASAISRASD
jgi:hypothetical protein